MKTLRIEELPSDKTHLFKPTWKHKETKVIRVPVALADTLLSVARHLDIGDSILHISKDDLHAIDAILDNFPGNSQADKLSSWINWSLQQITKDNLTSPDLQHQDGHH